jgi:hypothetical protein
MAVTVMNRPDFRTIATFRRRHLKALGDLFVQVLKLCRTAGLVRFGQVALDGTKVRADASVHKAMSYGCMRETENKLAAEVAAWFARAEATDAAEHREHGAKRCGDEMPDGSLTRSVALSASAPPKDILRTLRSEGNSRAEFVLHIPRSPKISAKSTEQVRRKNTVETAT